MAVNFQSKANQMQGTINTTFFNTETNGFLFMRKTNLRSYCHTRLKIKMNPTRVPNIHKICSKHWTTTPTNCLTSYYQNYRHQLISAFPQFQLTVPIPVIAPIPMFAQQICPYASSLYQTMVSPIVQPHIPENLSVMSYCVDHAFNNSIQSSDIGNVIFDQAFYKPKTIVTEINNTNPINNKLETKNMSNEVTGDDLIDVYLSLPKDLFPPARSLKLDPNPIIDEFCKMSDIESHTPWLLDIEFGIPKSPITRPIPIYNVKFNSIHCKNAPDAIHPSFEVCDAYFKKVLLFYYDCIVSAWYRGYVAMNCDRSVENFQSWLLLPMLVLGMCWP